MNKRKLRRILRESIRQVLLVENPNIDAAVEEVMEKVNSGYAADPNSIYQACQAAADYYGVSVDAVAERVFATVQDLGY